VLSESIGLDRNRLVRINLGLSTVELVVESSQRTKPAGLNRFTFGSIWWGQQWLVGENDKQGKKEKKKSFPLPPIL
jgi:hypothetical protein